MTELKIDDLLHPDYVEMIMLNIDEQLDGRPAYSVINQMKDVKKAMRDMQAMITELFIYDVRLAKTADNYCATTATDSPYRFLIQDKTFYGAVYKTYMHYFN